MNPPPLQRKKKKKKVNLNCTLSHAHNDPNLLFLIKEEFLSIQIKVFCLPWSALSGTLILSKDVEWQQNNVDAVPELTIVLIFFFFDSKTPKYCLILTLRCLTYSL